MPGERKHLNLLHKHHSFLHMNWSDVLHLKISSNSKTLNTIHPSLHTRVEALKAVLQDLEPSVNAINDLIQIYRKSGQYCGSCTPDKRHAGSCGSSCPLLRPKGGDPGIASQIRYNWVKHASWIKCQYLRIARVMRKADANPRLMPSADGSWAWVTFRKH